MSFENLFNPGTALAIRLLPGVERGRVVHEAEEGRRTCGTMPPRDWPLPSC